MKVTISPYNTSEYLRDEEDIAGYLEAIMEEDPALFPVALGDIARALGMAEIARKTGLSREALYRFLLEKDGSHCSTACKMLSAYGVNHITFGSSAPSDNAEAVAV